MCVLCLSYMCVFYFMFELYLLLNFMFTLSRFPPPPCPSVKFVIVVQKPRKEGGPAFRGVWEEHGTEEAVVLECWSGCWGGLRSRCCSPEKGMSHSRPPGSSVPSADVVGDSFSAG